MSAGFKTLRDQTGINDVAQHELKVIKKLGAAPHGPPAHVCAWHQR